MIFGRLVDLLQFPQAQKPAQVVGIGHVAFAAIPTDEEVLPRVAHQHLIDIGIDRAGCPSGQLARLHSEALLLRVDRRDSGNQLRFSRGKLLVALVGAVRGHHAEGRGICMQAESEVCCSHEGACGGLKEPIHSNIATTGVLSFNVTPFNRLMRPLRSSDRL